MTRMERRRIRRRRARIRLATVAAVALAVVGRGPFTMAGLTVEVTEASGPEVEKLVFQTVMDEGPEAAAEDQAVYEEDPLEAEKIEQALVEQGYFRDDVPLSYEDQDFLHTACNESGVPYALALAVIQKETGFRNVLGDDGASAGYMQVQERWHRDRMERLGVKDLNHPFGNFRVGCDFLAELMERYTVEEALTAYNRGKPGQSEYSRDVMENYGAWKELVGDDVSGIKS